MTRSARLLVLAATLLSASPILAADPSPRDEQGRPIPPTIPYCWDGVSLQASPCGLSGGALAVLVMPFVRSGNGDPIVFTNLGTTPKQFAVSKPSDATGYRFVNPCDVDIRIRKVSSMSEQVTATTGTLYLARSVEIMGTSNPTYLSAMTMAEPSTPCSPELQYGKGAGG